MQMLLQYVKVFVQCYFLIWECRLSRFYYCIYISLFLTCFSVQSVFAADVPVTVQDNFGTSVDERNTCDPEFWDVLKDRAWMEAQREVTQNQNLIARPDSVLEMTCFDSFLDELGSYSDSNFPSDPDWSKEGHDFLGVSLGSFIIDGILSLDQSALNGEPLLPGPLGSPFSLWHGGSGSSGLIMTAVLEILVLDQLVDGVTATGDAMDIANNPLFAACRALGGDKRYYLEQFPNRMLGGRAITTSATPGPAWSQILAGNADGNVRDSGNYNGCGKMNDLWNRTKCYDFATESYRHTIVPATPVTDPITAPPTPTAPPPGGEHDSFYSLERYRDMAAANDDYRTKDRECGIPTTDGEPDWPSNAEDIACDILLHTSGFPSSLTPAAFISAFTLATNSNPTWGTAYPGANPPPNATPASSNGGVDMYVHFLGLEDSSSCSSLTPIKTGYIVSLASGVQYIDAVCPAPGCYFDPPATIAGNGSCN